MENVVTQKKQAKGKRTIFSWVIFAVLVIYSLSLLIPIAWMLFSSVREMVDFSDNPFGWPRIFKFNNYSTAFRELSVSVQVEGGASYDVFMWEMLLYSLLYTLGATFISTLSHAVAAYIVAKYKFKLRNVIYSTVIVTMILPIVGSLPSEMQIVKAIGFYDNIVGVWLMKGSFLGTGFLIFYATFKGISWEYAEAAVIDGASHATIMFRIMFPLAKTTIAACALLSFIGFWNEYYTPMIYLPSLPPLAYGLFRFRFGTSQAASSIPIQLAGCTIVLLPILVIFIIFKDKLMGNIAVGGIKG